MLEHLKRISAALLLVGMAGPLLAQSNSECDNAPGKISVELRTDVGRKITSGSVVTLEIDTNRPNRKISRVVILSNRGASIEIGPQQIRTIIANSDASEGNTERHLTLRTIVQINGTNPVNLNVPAGKSTDVFAFAYDDGAPGDQYCGHPKNAIQLNTGRLGPFAVIVGFNYTAQSYELQFARDDALDVARHLVDRLHLAPENVFVYTDAEPQPGRLPDGVNVIVPTLPTQVTDKLSQIYDEADTNALVFFYFSGHQYFFNNTRYIVLGSSDLNDGHSMLAREDLFRMIAKPGAKSRNAIRTVSIFDACFSGSLVRYSGSAQEARTGAKFLGVPPPGDAENLPLLPGNAQFYSSHADELSWEFADDIKHGLFTSFFLSAASNRKADTSLGAAFDYALDKVQNYVPKNQTIVGLFRQKPLTDADSDMRARAWALADTGSP